MKESVDSLQRYLKTGDGQLFAEILRIGIKGSSTYKSLIGSPHLSSIGSDSSEGPFAFKASSTVISEYGPSERMTMPAGVVLPFRAKLPEVPGLVLDKPEEKKNKPPPNRKKKNNKPPNRK